MLRKCFGYVNDFTLQRQFHVFLASFSCNIRLNQASSIKPVRHCCCLLNHLSESQMQRAISLVSEPKEIVKLALIGHRKFYFCQEVFHFLFQHKICAIDLSVPKCSIFRTDRQPSAYSNTFQGFLNQSNAQQFTVM